MMTILTLTISKESCKGFIICLKCCHLVLMGRMMTKITDIMLRIPFNPMNPQMELSLVMQ